MPTRLTRSASVAALLVIASLLVLIVGACNNRRPASGRGADLAPATQRTTTQVADAPARGSAATERGTSTARGAAGATRPATTTTAATRPRTARPAPRAERTPAEYDALARELRAAYAKPPAQWPPATIDPGVEFVELGPLAPPRFPADNPFTEAKAELGKQLFFDPRLSGSGVIACASCHEPELGWADGRAVSFGHARAPAARNAPSLLNAAHRKHLFWDGRADSLEAQALVPIAADDEMHADPAVVTARLAAPSAYAGKFKEVFGDPNVTMERVAQALATYERTIVSRPSPFDRFLRGNRDALGDAAVRGLHLFRTDARCANCHHGPTLSDEKFHDLGLSYYGRKLQDLGRYEVTRDPADVGKFKTPSLRNVTGTAPYMHNGLFDLDGVLRMYNAGMSTLRRKASQQDDPLFPTKSPHLRPLALNERDLADLRAFLESLQETRLRVRPPALPGLTPADAEAADSGENADAPAP